MQQNHKNILIIVTLVALFILGYMYIRDKNVTGVDNTPTTTNPGNNNPGTTPTPGTSPELMSIDLYIQNKEIAQTSDCGVTQKVTYQVPQTSAVADASLKILFDTELSQFGRYDSINVTNGIARVLLESANTPSGRALSSLSSCESNHLTSVLEDTLTQYDSITRVELFSPQGEIEF